MKHTILAAAAVAALATAASADAVDGLWKTQPGETGDYLHVSIGPCGSAICGTIDNVFAPNGDERLGDENVGKQIIFDMIPDGDGAYGNGKIWAPDNGKTYNGKMSLNGNTLTVKGCVAGGLICRGQDWARIE